MLSFSLSAFSHRNLPTLTYWLALFIDSSSVTLYLGHDSSDCSSCFGLVFILILSLVLCLLLLSISLFIYTPCGCKALLSCYCLKVTAICSFALHVWYAFGTSLVPFLWMMTCSWLPWIKMPKSTVVLLPIPQSSHGCAKIKCWGHGSTMHIQLESSCASSGFFFLPAAQKLDGR